MIFLEFLSLQKAKTRELDKDRFNLNEYCHDANLVYKPKKRGTAVMWYNHKMDYKNGGWLGELDNYSLHGGCMVTAGEKWIANNWLTAPYHFKKEIPSIFLKRFEASTTSHSWSACEFFLFDINLKLEIFSDIAIYMLYAYYSEIM